MWYYITITCIFNDIWSVKDITIICCIASLRPCYSNISADLLIIFDMFLFLTIDFILGSNIISMSCIFQVDIIFSIYLDDIATLDLIDNISIFKLIVWILHQKFFTKEGIIRNFPIIVMIVITVWRHIALICNFDDNLLSLNSFFLANLIWCQVFSFLTWLATIHIRDTIIVLIFLRAMLVQRIGAKT